MKKFIIALGITAFIIACGAEPGTEGSASTSSTAGTTADAKPAPDGKKIYKQYCVTCHGLYGDMGASGAFNLTTSELSVEERVNVITNGRNTMTPFKALLSPEKIQAVAEYTLELKKD